MLIPPKGERALRAAHADDVWAHVLSITDAQIKLICSVDFSTYDDSVPLLTGFALGDEE